MADEKHRSQSELKDTNLKVVMDEALVEGKLEMALSEAKGFTLLPKPQASQVHGSLRLRHRYSYVLTCKSACGTDLAKTMIAYFIKKL